MKNGIKDKGQGEAGNIAYLEKKEKQKTEKLENICEKEFLSGPGSED